MVKEEHVTAIKAVARLTQHPQDLIDFALGIFDGTSRGKAVCARNTLAAAVFDDAQAAEWSDAQWIDHQHWRMQWRSEKHVKVYARAGNRTVLEQMRCMATWLVLRRDYFGWKYTCDLASQLAKR